MDICFIYLRYIHLRTELLDHMVTPCLLFFFLILFIYLCLRWVFVFVRGLSLVAASGGHSSSRCAGLSLLRPLLWRSTGSRRAGSVVVAHGPSCSAACGIFPDQGSNPCPLHWQADSQPLCHQGRPMLTFLRNCQLFFKAAASSYSSTNISKFHFFHIFAIFWIKFILVGLKWYVVILICISPMMLNIFMCLFVICIFSLEKCVFQFFAHLKNLVVLPWRSKWLRLCASTAGDTGSINGRECLMAWPKEKRK